MYEPLSLIRLAISCWCRSAPERLWILQQQEDEVLDYRKALTEYQFARLSLECGGNHAFTGFERYPAQIIHFLGL